ncbi:hypothetical protein GTO91_15055 [Heliobacterium undosum]|uniref:N-acetyltransferase domain-containing protein n=1 Tax=Heliomicrobium undosum TaxID=121734 RepID=A0A845L7L7_9FIRM|nr:hypothetical protein [Heliomicrobium undosum]MZP31035.1 hypothetical protein [Heliomicrobium undosum]
MNKEMVDFLPLKEMIEKEQEIQTILKKSENNIYIVPLKEATNSSNFLQITFRINEETLVLSWLYLLHENKGTGSRIIEWLINYCTMNNLNIFKIVNVERNKKGMRELCKKYNFFEIKCKEEFSDYYLYITPDNYQETHFSEDLKGKIHFE